MSARLWQLPLLTTILPGLLLVLTVVSIIVSVRRWRAIQSLVGDGTGIALAIDDHGIVISSTSGRRVTRVSSASR